MKLVQVYFNLLFLFVDRYLDIEGWA